MTGNYGGIIVDTTSTQLDNIQPLKYVHPENGTIWKDAYKVHVLRNQDAEFHTH